MLCAASSFMDHVTLFDCSFGLFELSFAATNLLCSCVGELRRADGVSQLASILGCLNASMDHLTRLLGVRLLTRTKLFHILV